ncbi:MAG: peptidoglycan-binding domain-containing protein [Alphaproteobacteria bacterium]|nr:peptidoglycan-binding domain-containing protein [Alphaproteobacteria bacterium]
MVENQKRTLLLATANICFVLVIAGAALSIFGLIDAYLAADLFVFDTLGNLHSTVFGAFVSVIAVIGIAVIMMATDGFSHDATGQHSKYKGLGLDLRLTEPRLTGQDVRRVQAMLHVLQYPLTIDGEFGPETDTIVRLAQKDAKIGVDGVVGQKTLAALQHQVEALNRVKWVSQILDQKQKLAPSVAELPQIGVKATG